MIDPRKFKAPFIPKDRIWQEADALRAKYPSGRCLPVRILDLAEFDLGLSLIPVDGLREQVDIEALLMGDLLSILVDKRAFMNPRLEYRLRFSIAHEIGHLILHSGIYTGLKHATSKEWATAELKKGVGATPVAPQSLGLQQSPQRQAARLTYHKTPSDFDSLHTSEKSACFSG